MNSLERTLSQLRGELARVEVQCGDVPCRVVVDEQTVTVQRNVEHIFYLDPGTHAVAAEFPNGTTAPTEVEATARGRAELEFESPPAPVEPPDEGTEPQTSPMGPDLEADQGGISPWFFVLGATATVGLGVGALVSGLQAVSAGDDFDNNGRTQALFDEADRLETLTNILIGVAGAAAATTILLAIFTDWDGEPEALPEGNVAVWSGPGRCGARP